MKKLYLFFVLLISSVLSALPSSSDVKTVSDTLSTPDEIRREKIIGKVKTIMQPGGVSDKSDSAINLLRSFYVDQFRHSRDPEIPYFMFMSKDARYTMGVGGVIRMRGWYDWNNIMPGTTFSPYNIMIPGDPSQKRHFDIGPQGTTIYLTFLGRNDHFRRMMVYIEGKFNGNGFAFNLFKAYMTLDDWTVGYAVTTFSDPAAQPPIIDGARPNGTATRRNILVRYLHDFTKNWSLAASVEVPHYGISDDSKEVKKCPAYVPDICSFLQYQWDNGCSHVRLSGLFRIMAYRDLLAARNRNVIGWGVGLTSVWTAAKPWKLYAAFNAGKGIGGYLSDLVNDNTDLLKYPGVPGSMYAPMSLGYVVGTQYYFRPNLYSTIAASEIRYLTKKGSPDDTYRYGTIVCGNLCYDITPRLGGGIEYIWGFRKNIDGKHGHANRITAFFQLQF